MSNDYLLYTNIYIDNMGRENRIYAKREHKNVSNIDDALKGINVPKTSADIGKNMQFRRYNSGKDGESGHGFAAEDANALDDRLRGKKVAQIGKSNKQDGADRIVDGKFIQTKYRSSAKETFNEICNTDGTLRYQGQMYEVPEDQYSEVVERLRNAIEQGKVTGVTDPNDAENIVKKGAVTYEQARMIAKAGNIQSIWFDAKSQMVVTSCIFGLSFILNYALLKWSGQDSKIALMSSLKAATEIGIISLVSGVLSRQMLRTEFLTRTSEDAVKYLKKCKLKKIALSSNEDCYNKAELRADWIGYAVTAVVITAVEAYSLIRGRISLSQFCINFSTKVVGGVGGAALGAEAGRFVGGAIGMAIGGDKGKDIGRALGKYTGSFLGSIIGSKAMAKLTGLICQSDAEKMIAIIQKEYVSMVRIYLLNDKECNEVVDEINKRITDKLLREMYSKSTEEKQIKFIHDEFTPIFDKVVAKREFVKDPNMADIEQYIQELEYGLV